MHAYKAQEIERNKEKLNKKIDLKAELNNFSMK
jgi:hypothetical protein